MNFVLMLFLIQPVQGIVQGVQTATYASRSSCVAAGEANKMVLGEYGSQLRYTCTPVGFPDPSDRK